MGQGTYWLQDSINNLMLATFLSGLGKHNKDFILQIGCYLQQHFDRSHLTWYKCIFLTSFYILILFIWEKMLKLLLKI